MEIIDGIKYAKNMREIAHLDNSSTLKVSKELWLQIADIIEKDRAIEFQRKIKVICENEKTCAKCPIHIECDSIPPRDINEVEFVRKVMEYQIKEVSE